MTTVDVPVQSFEYIGFIVVQTYLSTYSSKTAIAVPRASNPVTSPWYLFVFECDSACGKEAKMFNCFCLIDLRQLRG